MSGVYENTHPYWTARLAAVVAMSVKEVKPSYVKRDLETTLRACLDSGVLNPETTKQLREEMGKRA